VLQKSLATFKQAMEQLSAIGNIRVLVTGEMVSTAMAPVPEHLSNHVRRPGTGFPASS
jgi:hypothetical protein